MALNVELIESSFEAVAPRAVQLADVFYDTLFRDHPEVRSLFPDTMAEQKQKLISALALTVKSLREPEKLQNVLEDLGCRHVEYGAVEAHYPAVGQTLLKALAEVAGDAWNPELEGAWSEAYGAIQDLMLAGAANSASD